MIFKEFDGVLVFWKDQPMQLGEIENQLALFQLMYQQIHIFKKNQGLDIYDTVTELFNRNYFLKKLDEEMQRAKRLQQPLSIIRISMDQYAQIESTMGRANRDLILKAMSTLVKKTSRVNDICCRTEENHISILLPHSGQKGSTLRAERIRRLIENHSFAMSGLKVTVSCGVSEYPSLVNKSDELESSANQALQFVNSRGGNRVCLFRPASDFKPEFEVHAEPTQNG
jgi:diguanylate cyclase (GGDEF)-like protein